MNKKEAARMLGRSERGIERLSAQSKLNPRKVWKVSKDGRRRQVADYDPFEVGALKLRLALPRRQSVTAGMGAPSIIELAAMIALTIEQAARLSNVPEKELLRAITERKLKAFETGEGPRIRREDLNDYIKKL